ncbi:MAG: PilC/PilY family type IV pilus protein [Wenzhouxiangellaceae bacterium]
MKRFEKVYVGLVVGLLGFAAGAPAQADLNLSQSPLFLITPVQPSLIMAVDDSGSMDFEILVDANDGSLWWNRDNDAFTGLGTNFDGTSDVSSPGTINFNSTGAANSTWQKYSYLFPNGTGTDGRTLGDNNNDHFAVPPLPEFAYARSPEFNAIYFNPAEEYPPWPSEGSATFDDANPTAAKADPARGSQTWDLTQVQRSDDNNWTFRFQDEMVIPAGTVIRESDLDNCSTLDSNDFDDWTTVTTPIEINENICNIGVEYFPATFWLKAESGPPEGFIGTPVTGGEAPDGTPMLGYEIKPDNFSNYDQMIQRFANWFQYYRKRVHLTRASIGRSFVDVSFLRNGFFTINNRNDVTMRDLSVNADRQAFYDWQYDLDGNGGTPNRQAVEHLGNQFKRTGDNAPILEACQRNFGMLVTDGFSNAATLDVGNADGELPAPLGDNVSDTLADLAYTFYRDNLRPDLDAGRVPTPSACNQADPPLDLDCQEDPHMNLFSVTLGAKGIFFGRDEAATEDPFANPPDWPTSFPQRNPSSVDDIWHGTLNTRGEMFTATRPGELVEALSRVLREIASRIEPVGVSATSTRLDEDTQFFESELDSTTWSGNLRAIDANTGSSNWDAQSALPSPGARTIKTSINRSSENFTTSADVRTAIFGSSAPSGSEERTRQDQIINYLRGDQSNEEQNGGTLRDRDGVIGDIANSRPTFVGPVNEGWGQLSGYLEYIDPDSGRKKDLKLVLVGANDGMLHAFDSDSGVEQFAYIPSMVHENLAQLADPDYAHRFFVDGQIGVGDVNLGGWTTVAVAGLGAGGKGVFAIDLQTEEVLWEITEDDLNVGDDIGHVFGKPVVTRAGDDWVAVFGNGYNSVNGRAGLIVVDIRTGVAQRLVETISPDTDNGLSEVAVFMDPVERVNALRAYAGDLKGNMWRFDFDGGTRPTSKFDSNPLIQVDDDRPITSAPTLAALPGGGIMVFFGSGKLLETADRVGAASEFDRFWAVRDRDNRFNNTNSLAEATMVSEGGGARSIDGVEGAADGWFLDLGVGQNPTGERVLAKPVVTFGRLVFTTFEPDDDPCAPGGLRRIYLLNALNASGQFDTPDCTNCGVIEVGLGAPIDPAIVLRPPETADRFDDNDPPPPFDPGDGSLPDGSTVGSVTRWCSTLFIQVAGEGQVPIGNICDGRQVWRQAR